MNNAKSIFAIALLCLFSALFASCSTSPTKKATKASLGKKGPDKSSEEDTKSWSAMYTQSYYDYR